MPKGYRQMPTCQKCGQEHWSFKPCNKTVISAKEASPQAESKSEASAVIAKVTPKKSSHLGFPRPPGQFGFEAGVPFSGSFDKFKRELKDGA